MAKKAKHMQDEDIVPFIPSADNYHLSFGAPNLVELLQELINLKRPRTGIIQTPRSERNTATKDDS